MFFVISGLLMAGIVLGDLQRKRFRLADFIWSVPDASSPLVCSGMGVTGSSDCCVDGITRILVRMSTSRPTPTVYLTASGLEPW